ncbi:DUF5681 domain-containing protein [Hyphomicrobium sp. MC1]|uniref:DUF5681 domain-containing protein n=1 Tax=Hyphomicrobium sp. (strain MC1) TaxID=717785 RepID=UPI000213E6BA|nr:DUF5681 domain-containing protein [Hyphomicrobium sp. MC1]CCB66553.1 conserved protein of unknown function [Hyphomicrobium sp. MC1]
MTEKPIKVPPKDAVGYGRPPKQHQFKPGQSGNPKGRPKSTPTIQQIMAKEATKHVKIKQGENIVTVSKMEALARRVFSKALEGDLSAARVIFQLAAEPETAEGAGSKEPFTLPGDDAIKRMLKRFDHLNTASGSK